MPEIVPNQAAFNTAIESPNLSVVHFGADWAEQCTQVDDVLDVLSKRSEYSKIRVYRVQAEALHFVAMECKVEAVPTVLLFRSGKVLDRIDGADPVTITKKVQLHYEGSESNEDSKAVLTERLKALINQAPVMLFMKGNKVTPRCGFSRQIIEILNDTGAAYETFDILTDEEVRQELKVYSDWPTYPQLYVKGELIGGLDIVKEMKASGDLAATLNV